VPRPRLAACYFSIAIASEVTTPTGVSRRTFLGWWMASLITATTVAVIAPVLVYLWPPPPKGEKDTDVKVALDTPLDQLKDGQAVKFEAPKDTALTMIDGGGDNAPGELAYGGYAVKNGDKVTVFAINCSHLGCSIAINENAKTFDCPCHGSRFRLDGTVAHGPAVAPLSHLKWKQGENASEILVGGKSFAAGQG
jgi:menaquinol-cytochrome c reductase iron-sulfur subunit